MRSQFASRGGFVLIRTPSHRQQSARRKLAVVCGVAALALAAGVIGSLTSPSAAVAVSSTTGPFSYFPSE